MIIRLAMIVILTVTQTTWAQCPKDVQVIEKGQVANCTGVLLSPDASKKTDEAIVDARYYKDLSDLLFKRRDLTNKEINILDERLNLYIDQSQLLATQLAKKENNDVWQKFGYLALGVIITGVAYKNLSP